MWRILPEITEDIIKKIKRTEILSRYRQQLAFKMTFGNGQEDINT